METPPLGGWHRFVRLESTAVRACIVSTILTLSWLAMAAEPAMAGLDAGPTCREAPYDIDGNSEIDPLSDGILLLRYFFDFRGDVLVDDAIGDNCTRCTAPAIEDFIELALAGCPECGNGIIEADEECDSENLDGLTCTSAAGYFTGELACNEDCTLDFTDCNNCGDGFIDLGVEVCDGDNLGGANCQSIGYSGGDLTCGELCIYDDSECF